MPAEPDYDGDYDYEDEARERELMLDDLADYNDDFSHPNVDITLPGNRIIMKFISPILLQSLALGSSEL